MDIKDRSDIEQLINSFYEKVRKDNMIGYIFNDVVKVDWEKHLPVMYDFWESLILNTANYNSNAMGVHFLVNKKVPLEKKHFERWMEIFTSTVDALFEGEVAEMTKKRAKSIADLMQFKMNKENSLLG